MRTLMLASALLLTAGCATTDSSAPREYLDEETAATITTVAKPWVFNRQDAPPQLDFFKLYAIDVNRMGDHKQYLVVMQYWPDPALRGASAPTLLLRGPDQEFALQPIAVNPRQLGIAQSIDKSAPAWAQSSFYPIDKAKLQAIAQIRELSAVLITGDMRAPYAPWRDGSEAFSEFATAALD
jgi:hypothetical protein